MLKRSMYERTSNTYILEACKYPPAIRSIDDIVQRLKIAYELFYDKTIKAMNLAC